MQNPNQILRQGACAAIVLVLATSGVASADSPTGRWRGGWHSDGSNHQGTLGARIRPTGPDSYRAVFYGRFAVVVPFIYRTDLHRVPGTCNCYTSTKQMPILGEYRMTASVSQNRFYAKFRGKKDQGTFDLSR
ncbi:MAG: hypothetical protein WBD20_17860 [Pirellulaceae bacterium]